MKKTFVLAVMIAMVLGFTLQANAALELRGTDNQSNRLIYDTDFNITWYDFSNSYGNWQNQMNWADALSVSGGDLVGVYDDWRLPTALNQNGTGPCIGYNCTSSEMGHLYYTELGNPAGGPLTYKGDFQKLYPEVYWLDMKSADYTWEAWDFNPYNGFQYSNDRGYEFYALAVRPGDVAVVPEPVSMVLFGVGATVMAARKKLSRRRG